MQGIDLSIMFYVHVASSLVEGAVLCSLIGLSLIAAPGCSDRPLNRQDRQMMIVVSS